MKNQGGTVASNVCVAKINGEKADLRTVVLEDCELEIFDFNLEDRRHAFRHTVSHIMAQAMKRLYLETFILIKKLSFHLG